MPEAESPVEIDILAEPISSSGFVAVIGRPNVGKSTLLNLVLGQKIAITSDKPQTTRDQILGIRTDDDAQFIFLDTPGIHQPRNKLGKHMVNVAEQAITSDADVILWLVDVTTPPTDDDIFISGRLEELYKAAGGLPFLMMAANKTDSLQGANLFDRQIEYGSLLDWLTSGKSGQDAIPVLPISATSGEGVDALLTSLAELLPPGPPLLPERTGHRPVNAIHSRRNRARKGASAPSTGDSPQPGRRRDRVERARPGDDAHCCHCVCGKT